MSGYRSVHREQVLPEDTAIWSCQATPLLQTKPTTVLSKSTAGGGGGAGEQWRIWTASSDGVVRSYVAQSPSRATSTSNDTLQAAALQLRCTHILTGRSSTPSASSLGCSVVHTVRNYAGEDTNAGDLVVASLDMAGMVRVWTFPANWDENEEQQQMQQQQQQQQDTPEATATAAVVQPLTVACCAEFTVDNATGTTLQLASPRVQASPKDIVVAVGCLDGTIAIVSTGIATPNAPSQGIIQAPSPAGTVLE